MSADLIEQVKALDQAQRAELADLLAPHVSIGRRSFLGIAGVAGGAAMVPNAARAATREAVQPAAAADGLLSDIDVLESGDGTPIGFGNAVEFDHQAVSSATTIGNTTYVYYDSSVAGFTITIPASLESRGGFLVFIDEGASAATNTVDITSANWTVDGAASSTIDANQSVYKLAANPSQTDWTSRIFTDTVDARTIATEKASINDLSAVLEKTTNQAISSSTDTTIDWDSQDEDTDLYTYTDLDPGGEIDVLEAGDYVIGGYLQFTSVTDQGDHNCKILVNNSEVRRPRQQASGTVACQVPMGGITLKDLSANDTIRFDVRTNNTATLNGQAFATFITITRSG